MASAFSNVAMSSRKGRDSPWRNALRLDFNRPAAVLGPVLFCALARLAASCFSVAIKALLLVGDLVGIVILAPGTNVMKTGPICSLLGLGTIPLGGRRAQNASICKYEDKLGSFCKNIEYNLKLYHGFLLLNAIARIARSLRITARDS